MSENLNMPLVLSDRFRIDWLSANPVNTKWDHRRGWVVSTGFPFVECSGPTFQMALDAAITKHLAATNKERGPCHCATLPHRHDCPSV